MNNYIIHVFPIVGTIFYVNFSIYLRDFFSRCTTCEKNEIIKSHELRSPEFSRPPTSSRIEIFAITKPLYYFSIVHNAGLAWFSFYICKELSNVIWSQGFHPGNNIYMSQPYIKYLIGWFYLSKYYEYVDTFLLYCKRRDPIFLQKYHHIGAVICWHLCYVYNVDMIIIGTILNSGVHTVMYSYYCATLFKMNIRTMKIYITSMQLAQLTIGFLFGTYYYLPPIETIWNYSIIWIFNIYIMGLFYLFGKFFVETYHITFFNKYSISGIQRELSGLFPDHTTWTEYFSKKNA